MRMDSLRDLYNRELHEMHDGERKLLETLPRMAAAAHDESLQEHLTRHVEATRRHRERLERILEESGEPADEMDGVRAEGIRGVVREVETFLEAEGAREAVLDAALLALAQRFEHLEMAAYGALRTYARLLGEEESERLLQKTLDEEGSADDALTRIATRAVNPEALN